MTLAPKVNQLSRSVEALAIQRAQIVAAELMLATGQVLRDQYGWDSEQISAFLRHVQAQAQANREASRG